MEKENKHKKEVINWIKIIIITIIISLVAKNYVFERIHINGYSMMPTLNNNDSVLIEKLSLLTNNFKRGQIIIFDSENKNHDVLIKRIIGVEGDEIELIKGKVYLNGKILKEPYLEKNIITDGGTFLNQKKKIKIEKGFVFLLGDNRVNSKDSRYFGPINIKSIKGHIILKIFPLGQIKLLF
ncbi:signal peptidase I [Clostridium sp. BJN0013]|uniref:signal peptidase I n=1 Tax=Clostridium sp. BJN0013 TaxID=3236840 RepID=UPI0034C6442A